MKVRDFIFLIITMVNVSCNSNTSETGNDFHLKKEFLVSFEEIKDTLIFKATIWGIAGNHYKIVLQNAKDSTAPSVTFFESELFYEKKLPDTLVIYSGAFEGELKDLSPDINFVHMNNYNFHDFLENHESYGVKLVSAYEYK